MGDIQILRNTQYKKYYYTYNNCKIKSASNIMDYYDIFLLFIHVHVLLHACCPMKTVKNTPTTKS